MSNIEDAGIGELDAGPDLSTDVEAGAAGEPVASGAADGTTPTAPSWTPDDPAFLEAVDQRLAAYGVGQQQYDPQGYGQEQPQFPQLDPFSEDYTPQLLGAIGQMLDQRLAPLQAREEAQTVQQGIAESMQTFASYTDLGEFNHTNAFREAQELARGVVQRLGTDDPNVVGPYLNGILRQAAEKEASEAKGHYQRGWEAHKAEMARAAGNGGPAEPGIPGGATEAYKEPTSYDDVVRSWINRDRAGAV